MLSNPGDLGEMLVLGACASFAKALWLVPASLALGLCARALLPPILPGSSGRELLWLAAPVPFAISELWLH